MSHKTLFISVFFSLFFLIGTKGNAQKTVIRGFVDVLGFDEKGKVGFGLGEQDLFITSEINDRISFLGESVFKYTAGSPTQFSVSIERVVLKYNFYGNNNLIVGKVHTPLNYWNYTYHHGRLLFPTIERPLLFAADIIPLHTTGIGVQGQDMGDAKFGYDVFVGSGIGSSEIADNDKRKSVTLGMHIRPANALTLGVSYYNDGVAKGAKLHDGSVSNYNTKQNLFTAYVANFGNKVELLAEGTLAHNHTDSLGTKESFAGYVYAGFKIKEKLVPYVRFDNLNFQAGEMLFHNNNMRGAIAGVRYEINYLAVVKVEYQHSYSELTGKADKVSAQFAIGF